MISRNTKGLLFGVSAYGLWGAFPLFIYQLKAIDPIAVLAFRSISACLAILPIMLFLGRGKIVLQKLTNWRSVGFLGLSSFLVFINWGAFVYVVSSNQTLQSSLAYYINPLLNVLVGGLLLGERFRKMQWACILIAIFAVVIFAWEVGQIPYWALFLGATFSCYGLVRRSNPADSLTALTIETIFMFPVSLAYLYYNGSLFECWHYTPTEKFWLISSGLITVIPLLLFGGAATRLKFSTLGLVQYLTPTGQFLCAVYAFGETMLFSQWVCFGLIWLTLILFSVDTIRATKEKTVGTD